ncbi:hypothetical protein TSUD_293300 [Trifolium subterraneum]|uniref:Reverse transcriptase domain-containing protein n=1 Tax=Trifolium subterraneum TaxID=3900 RepID=A0A2Z6MB23_TRISU|nr:hypothetical protein TSUD_293300 [Trifolium subterraneum]
MMRIKWMQVYVFNSSRSVLVNGSPTADFKVEKGLRQGDPLSPFLFLIVAEGLTKMVNQAVELDYYKGFKVSDNLKFNILQFVDDTILVGDDNWENLWCIKYTLRNFELVSGLKVNFHKRGRNEGNNGWFSSNINSVLGNGSSINFWQEKWLGATPLCVEFPHLFRCESNKEDTIIIRGKWEGGDWEWHWNWREDLSNIDMTELSDLEGVLQGIKPNINEEDKCRWIADPSGNFSVHSCYNLLVSSSQTDMVDHNVIRALNDLWLNDIPSKIGVFGGA